MSTPASSMRARVRQLSEGTPAVNFDRLYQAMIRDANAESTKSYLNLRPLSTDYLWEWSCTNSYKSGHSEANAALFQL
jgi:hypothetical protein